MRCTTDRPTVWNTVPQTSSVPVWLPTRAEASSKRRDRIICSLSCAFGSEQTLGGPQMNWRRLVLLFLCCLAGCTLPSIPWGTPKCQTKKNKTLCLPVIDHDAVEVEVTSAHRGIAGLTRSYLLATVVLKYAEVYEDKLRDFGVTLRRRIN